MKLLWLFTVGSWRKSVPRITLLQCAPDIKRALEYAQDNDAEWLLSTFGAEALGSASPETVTSDSSVISETPSNAVTVDVPIFLDEPLELVRADSCAESCSSSSSSSSSSSAGGDGNSAVSMEWMERYDTDSKTDTAKVQALVALGYSAAEIRVLKPEVRRVIRARGTRRPRNGIPSEWTLAVASSEECGLRRNASLRAEEGEVAPAEQEV